MANKKGHLKKIKGMMPAIDIQTFDDEPIHSPFLAALQNPDLMGEDCALWPERDYDREVEEAASRRLYLERFKAAVETLTPKQRAVIDALQQYDNQETAAAALGIARSTLAVTLRQVQRKISRFINNLEKPQ